MICLQILTSLNQTNPLWGRGRGCRYFLEQVIKYITVEPLLWDTSIKGTLCLFLAGKMPI